MRKLSMDELNRISVEKFKQVVKIPLICVLDNIRSQHNIGSIFRTADAFKIESIHICGISATPPNREISKSALGATESVDWRYFPSTLESVVFLKEMGYLIVGIEQVYGSVDIRNFEIKTHEKIAVVFGNEVNGVSDEVLELCDYCVEIPQFGTKHSFNVSVTAGIVLFHFSEFLSIMCHK